MTLQTSPRRIGNQGGVVEALEAEDGFREDEKMGNDFRWGSRVSGGGGGVDMFRVNGSREILRNTVHDDQRIGRR